LSLFRAGTKKKGLTFEGRGGKEEKRNLNSFYFEVQRVTKREEGGGKTITPPLTSLEKGKRWNKPTLSFFIIIRGCRGGEEETAYSIPERFAGKW